MKRLFLIIFTLCLLSLQSTKAQVDSSLFNVIVDSLYNNYLRFDLSQSELGPVEVLEINLQVLSYDNNYISKNIRQLVLSKKFNSEKEVYNWLLPRCNKKALEKYYLTKNPLITKYADFFERMNALICGAYKDVSYHHNSDSVNYYYYKKIQADTSVINEQKRILENLSDDEKIKLAFSGEAYIKTHCNVHFDKLISLLKDEEGFITQYNNNLSHFKFNLVATSIKFYHDKKIDSLKQNFPNYNQYNKELSFLNAIYINSDFGKKIHVSSEELYTSDTLTRTSVFFIEDNMGKAKIKCQIVFEVGMDKPDLYIKTIKVYPREKLQNIQKLDAGFDEYIKEDNLKN